MNSERLAEIAALIPKHEANECSCCEQFYPADCGAGGATVELLAEVDRLRGMIAECVDSDHYYFGDIERLTRQFEKGETP